MEKSVDDRLYGGLIRLHVPHHADEEPIYGHWMIEELRRHGLSHWARNHVSLLHGLERKGYLRARRDRVGSRYRKVYRITTSGR